MTDTGNNRMVKKKQTNKKKKLNIKHLRSACLEIFFSLFRPWCEVEICVFWVWYPSPLVLRPLPTKNSWIFPLGKPNNQRPGRWINRSQFDLWSVPSCCLLGQDTLLWQFLSPGRSVLSIRDRLLFIAGAEKQGFWLCHNKIYLIPPLRLSSILTPSPPLIGMLKKPVLSSSLSLSPPPPPHVILSKLLQPCYRRLNIQ